MQLLWTGLKLLPERYLRHLLRWAGIGTRMEEVMGRQHTSYRTRLAWDMGDKGIDRAYTTPRVLSLLIHAHVQELGSPEFFLTSRYGRGSCNGAMQSVHGERTSTWIMT